MKNDNIKITVDGMPIEVSEGTTILDAAKKAGVNIDTLCYSGICEKTGGCMICAVNDKKKETFLPACSRACEEDMDIDTASDDVRRFRRAAIELLLSDHRGSCIAPCSMVCPQFLDIPLYMRKIGLFNDAKSLVYNRDICDKCGGKCEKACRRQQIDSKVDIRGLLYTKAQETDERPSRPGGNVKEYVHLLGRYTHEEIDDILKRSGQDIQGDELENEAKRCLQCSCSAEHKCDLRHLATKYKVVQRAYVPSDITPSLPVHAGNIIFEHSKCIKCSRCVCLSEKIKPGRGLVMAYRSRELMVSPPFGMGYADVFEGIEKELIEECPTGAIGPRVIGR